jgi:predicted MPP superfamily phosphohydrolase
MSSRRSLRNALAIALVAAAASAFLAGLHYYIARRLVLDPGWPAPWRQSLLAAIAVLGATLVAQPVVERLLRPPLSRLVSWPASLWMGFAFLALLLLGASDAVLWVAGGVARAAPDVSVGAERTAALRAVAVAAAVLVAGAVGLRTALRPPALRRVEIRLARWPVALDGFRIVQLSDLHIGPILRRGFAEKLVAEVDRLAPDLIAVTGDLVDGSVRQLEGEVEPLGELSAPHGVYFVTGNHDYYSGAETWLARIEQLGIRPLRNERVRIGDGDGAFDLAGVDDHRGDWLRGSSEDLTRALGDRDPDRPVVLLAHDPASFDGARAMGVDLQISGHTHGGQIWPFGYLVRLAVPQVAGLLRRGRSQLYVSRGSGFWGPPIRLFAPSEITEIVIRPA